uniref:Uncharacterized protein n=1 Tax=Anguilla anguilla TaxID=7936 RepID=A0A0E9V7Q8_ANGAN
MALPLNIPIAQILKYLNKIMRYKDVCKYNISQCYLGLTCQVCGLFIFL